MFTKVKTIKKQKGFVAIELMLIIGVVVLATIFAISMMWNYFNKHKINASINNIKLIQKHQKSLNYQLLNDFPENTVTERNGKYYLMPTRKMITISPLNNTFSNVMQNERIGNIISIGDLETKECIAISGKLAPSFYQTFIVSNNANDNSTTNLVKLNPQPINGNAGRNKVNMSELIKKCNEIRGNKKIIFRDVMQIDIDLINSLYNKDVEENLVSLSDDYVELKEQLKNNKEKAKKLEKLQQDLIKYRENQFN